MKLFSSILFVVILFTGCGADNQTPGYTKTNPDFAFYQIFNGKYDIIEFTPAGNANLFCMMINGSMSAGVRCYPKQSNQLTKEIKWILKTLILNQ